MFHVETDAIYGLPSDINLPLNNLHIVTEMEIPPNFPNLTRSSFKCTYYTKKFVAKNLAKRDCAEHKLPFTKHLPFQIKISHQIELGIHDEVSL